MKSAHPTHHTGAVVPVHRAFAWVSHSRGIALPSKEYGMNEGLGFVKIVEEEEPTSDETQNDGQVV